MSSWSSSMRDCRSFFSLCRRLTCSSSCNVRKNTHKNTQASADSGTIYSWAIEYDKWSLANYVAHTSCFFSLTEPEHNLNWGFDSGMQQLINWLVWKGNRADPCGVPVASYLDSILCVCILSNLRHLQELSCHNWDNYQEEASHTACIHSPKDTNILDYKCETQTALSGEGHYRGNWWGMWRRSHLTTRTHPLEQNVEIRYMPKGIYYFNISSWLVVVGMLIFRAILQMHCTFFFCSQKRSV